MRSQAALAASLTALAVVILAAGGGSGHELPATALVDTQPFPGVLRPVNGPRAAASPSRPPSAPISSSRLVDRLGEPSAPPAMVRPAQPQPTAAVVEKLLTDGGGSHALTGLASWYCRAGQSPCHRDYPDTGGFDAYAAAGPKLRAALCGSAACTSWRGRLVRVDGIRVKLVDWCQCYRGRSYEKLIDLYHDVFVVTGGNVVIRW